MFVFTSCSLVTASNSGDSSLSSLKSSIQSVPYESDLVVKVKVKVTLRLTVSQSVSLGIEPHLGPMTRYLFLSDSYVLISVGRPLWREDGSVFCVCRWALPAQSFSDPSPLGLATVFYCLRFEISHFVASYDSQGHGGGCPNCLPFNPVARTD
jgi:hypothetical protein